MQCRTRFHSKAKKKKKKNYHPPQPALSLARTRPGTLNSRAGSPVIIVVINHHSPSPFSTTIPSALTSFKTLSAILNP